MKSPSVTKSLQGKSFAERGATQPRIISALNLAFPGWGRGTALAVDEASFDFQTVRAKHVVASVPLFITVPRTEKGCRLGQLPTEARRERTT